MVPDDNSDSDSDSDDDDDDGDGDRWRFSRDEGYTEHYNAWRGALKEDIYNPPHDPFAEIKGDPGWKRGKRNLRNWVKFVLEDAQPIYRLIHTQFQMVMEFLPAFIPSLFGINFYSLYEKQIFHLLGARHNKLFVLYVGSRRDGKTVTLTFCIAGLLLHASLDDGPILLPTFGPSEETSKRLVGSVANILKNSKLKPYVDDIVSKQTKGTATKCSVFLAGGAESLLQSFALTEARLRGISSVVDFTDEFFAIPDYNKIQKLMLSRYGQTGVGGVAITTPHFEHRWSEMWDSEKTENSTVAQVLHRSRICREHAKSVQHPEDYEAALKACEDAGHVEVQDVPWKSDKQEKGWSVFFDPTLLLQEILGATVAGDELFQYVALLVRVPVFKQRSQATQFMRFDVGIDPCGHGASRAAISMIGQNGDRFDLVAQDATLMSDEVDQLDWFMSCLRTYLGKFCPNGKTRVYLWVERALESTHGYSLQQSILDEGWGGHVRVMRGTGPLRHARYTRLGVIKTKGRTKEMTRITRKLIAQNRFKINQYFYSLRGARTLVELETQFNNYVLDKRGKLTGKATASGPAQDDNLISLSWALWGAVTSLRADSKFHPQLAFTRRTIQEEMQLYAHRG